MIDIVNLLMNTGLAALEDDTDDLDLDDVIGNAYGEDPETVLGWCRQGL